MDTYEVHVPCGHNVLVVCKEKGEGLKVVKNGESVYGEAKKNNTGPGNLPRLVETKKENGNLPRLVETKKENGNLPRLVETKKENGDLPRVVEDKDEENEAEENNSEEQVENNMAGGKKSRRNSARKNNVTRRKGQAGGKRGPNGYMKFANKIRPQILKEHPELKSDVVGVARKIGEKWRSLSDAEKKKY
jgi:hypothetical protein